MFVCARAVVRVCVCVYACVCVCVHACVLVPIHNMHYDTRPWTHIWTHTYGHTHMDTHTLSLPPRPFSLFGHVPPRPPPSRVRVGARDSCVLCRFFLMFPEGHGAHIPTHTTANLNTRKDS